jgi:hypothetical protein
MEQRIQVSFSTDGEGFISQRCPSCNRKFKIRINEEGDDSLTHCPYCGCESEEGWLTEEQEAYALGVFAQQAVDPMLEEFTRELNRMNHPGGLISVSGHYEKTNPPPKPVESDEPMPLIIFACCGEQVKHDGSLSQLFCIACGKMVDVSG